MILGESGDITRFPNLYKVLAFTVLDTAVYQSGNFNTSHTMMSKRGSRPFRCTLINVAHNVVRNKKHLKPIMTKRFLNGKMVRLLHKMLTDNNEF